MKQLGATVVVFKEHLDSQWENGIAIAESPGDADVKFIVAMDGRVLSTVWDFMLENHRGCFILKVEE